MIRQNQKRIEKLNLVLSYPIDWSVHRVFEDFIQNFFDAIGCDNFSEDFIYSFDEEEKQLVMKSGIPFSMDWLRYIGVSTKRGIN